jgi:L-malate glycosyltransferase
MKILTIQAAYFPMIGGAEIFHQKTAEFMASKNHQVDILTCIWDKADVVWDNWKKEKEELSKTTIYRVKPFSYIQYLKSIGAIIPLYKKALQLIKKNNYDLIHAHIYPASIVGAMLKKKTKLPLIITVQGGDLADYSETGGIASLFLEPMIGKALQKANLVHVVSKYLEKEIKEMGVNNIVIIPNGVDTNIFKPSQKTKTRKKLNISKSEFLIVSHSRLTPKNGIDLLIRSIKPIASKYELKLLLVGGGEQEVELKQLVKQEKLNNDVKFLGYLPSKKTAEILSSGDLFVRASRNEGFGISFIEAMACEIPVIGTKVGGIPNVVSHNIDGILIKPESVENLTQNIELLINDKKLYEKLRTNGLKKARKYDWRLISKQFEKLYLKFR